MTASPNTVVIQRGHSAALTLTLTPNGGFAGGVSLSCGTLPQYVSCVFSPPTLAFTATSTVVQTDTLTIYTNLQQTASATPHKSDLLNRNNAGSLAMLFWLPGSVLALFGLSRKGARRLNKQLKSLLLLALVVSGFGVAATIAAAPTTAPATATPPRRAPIRFRSPLQALTAPSSRSTPPSPSSKPSRSGAKLVPSPSSDPAFGRKLFCDDQAWTSVPSTVRCPLGLLPKNVSPGELL